MNKFFEMLEKSFYTNVGSEEMNLEELSKKGKVTDTETEINGVITKEIVFVSEDGNTIIKRKITLPKNFEEQISIKKKKADLKKQITDALSKENYELCSKLTKELNELGK